MNMKDVALLKFGNIDGDFLRIIRAKTQMTSRTGPELISIYINEDMLRIMDLRCCKDKYAQNHIFRVLSLGLSAYQIREKVQLFIKLVNNWMAEITKAAGIETKVHTMHAHHSFSTRLKRAGINTEFIREALGHKDIKTTQNYLDSFEDDTKKEFAMKLMAFKDIPDSAPTTKKLVL
jgi:integrase/recombinase XerD